MAQQVRSSRTSVPGRSMADECTRASEELISKTLTSLEVFSQEHWKKEPHVSVAVARKQVAGPIIKLLEHGLIFCFSTRRLPKIEEFKEWISRELTCKRGWEIEQTCHYGPHYYLVVFEKPTERNMALEESRFGIRHWTVYTAPWDPEIDMTHYVPDKIPVWIEFPKRKPALARCGKDMASALGKVLYYCEDDERMLCPDEKACILWTIRSEVPQSVKVIVEGNDIFQRVCFMNLPSWLSDWPSDWQCGTGTGRVERGYSSGRGYGSGPGYAAGRGYRSGRSYADCLSPLPLVQ